MASIAKSIVDDIVQTLEGISEFTGRVYRKLPTFEELKTFAETQFPCVAVVSHLPEPQQYEYHPQGRKEKWPLFRVQTQFIVRLHVYDNVAADPTSRALDLYDLIFAALLVDNTRGGLVDLTEIFPEDLGYWDPYLAMIIEVRMEYKHGKTAI